MRVTRVQEVCQERKPTLHTHSCAHAVHAQCTHSTLSPTSLAGKGQREAGKPLAAPCPFGDKLRPGESSTETGWGLGNS